MKITIGDYKMVDTRMKSKWMSGNLVIYPSSCRGTEFHVDSNNGASTNNGLDWDNPLSAIDDAINLCTSNMGDIIWVAPNHSETITTAAGIDADISGISIIGLGNGTQRPTITFSTSTGADLDVDASDITFENIIFKSGVDALIAPIDLNAAGCTFRNCDFIDTSAYQTLTWIQGVAGTDWFTMEDCRNIGSSTAGCSSFMTLIGADDCVIRHVTSYGDFTVSNIELKTTACRRMLIEDCDLYNMDTATGAVCITGVGASDGTIRNNTCWTLADGSVNWISTVTAFNLSENYGANLGGETGKLIGTVSTS